MRKISLILFSSICLNIAFAIILIFSLLRSNPISEKIIYKNYDIDCKNDDYKKLIVTKGDTNAYANLDTEFFKSDFYYEMLPFALIMSNKWDYVPANYDVYVILFDLYDCEPYKLDCFDKFTAKMALTYLIRAYEKEPKSEFYFEQINDKVQQNFIIKQNGKFYVNEDFINNTLK